MAKAFCGVQLIDRKGIKYLIHFLGLNEIMVQLAVSNSTHWNGCCLIASSIAKMWCFTVSVGAVHVDSTVSVVSFGIAGTLKQKVGVALPASTAQPPKR